MRLLALFLLLAACSSPDLPTGPARAQQLVDAAIAAHGGVAYDPSHIAFTFRGEHFDITRDGGRFAYGRTVVTPGGDTVRDVLDNDGLRRAVNGRPVPLTDDEARAATSTVNSVPYFVLLPYRLNDPAVVKTYAGPDTVGGQPYECVAVSFRAEGGGPDFEDRYLFWFHRDHHTMDYLAYTFDGGTRFRAAQHVRQVGGLRFADYLNLSASPEKLGGDLARYGELYDAGALDTVSVVEITEVQVAR